MVCVCALGIASPQPVFGVLCQMTQCVWFMSSGKVAFPARVDVCMVNGEILNLLTYNEWWLMFWYRSYSLSDVSVWGDICSNKIICIYSKAHCTNVESMTLIDTFSAWWQQWKVCKGCLKHLHGHFYTHFYTALALHSLFSTQCKLFPSMVQVPCIVNERNVWVKNTQNKKTRSKRMQFRPISG